MPWFFLQEAVWSGATVFVHSSVHDFKAESGASRLKSFDDKKKFSQTSTKWGFLVPCMYKPESQQADGRYKKNMVER